MRQTLNITRSKENVPAYSISVTGGGFCYSFITKDNFVISPTHVRKSCFEQGIAVLLSGVNNVAFDLAGYPGWKHDFTINPLDQNNTRILFFHGCTDKKVFLDKIEAAEDFANQLSEEMGMEPTKIYLGNDTIIPGYNGFSGVAVGDKNYSLSPVLWTLWMLFLRLGLNHTKGKDWRKIVDHSSTTTRLGDLDRLKVILPTIEKFIKFGYEEYFGDNPAKNWVAPTDPKFSVWSFGADTGIYSLSQKNNYIAKNFPWWIDGLNKEGIEEKVKRANEKKNGVIPIIKEEKQEAILGAVGAGTL